jgi:glucose-6-phosphate 1-epimerase
MSVDLFIADLNTRFSIPNFAIIVPGNNNLPKIQITLPSACAEIYLHGAQITSWKPAGYDEVLFLSGQSRWEDGKAIRGGVPICFPWFRDKTTGAGEPKAPAHGFVRTKSWKLQSISHLQDTVEVTLATTNDEQGRRWWPFEFGLLHRITVGTELKLELIVSNTAKDPFRFEQALHTYNRVGEVENIRITGLDHVHYLDNCDQNREKIQQGDIQLSAPTDNAYVDTAGSVTINDPVLNRRIQLDKLHSQTTIVWNPWQERAAALADLGDDEWHQFACVEAGNIRDEAVILNPGEQHILVACITVKR